MAFTAILGAVTVGTGIAGIVAQNNSANAQKQANALSQQQADLSAAREQRNAIRQTRIAAAEAEQNSETQGVSQSSSAQGGRESIQSQGDSNISFLDQTHTISNLESQKLGDAQAFANQAQEFAAISKVASSIFGEVPTIKQAASSIFGGGSGGGVPAGGGASGGTGVGA